ncbi:MULTISPECIES: ABC transporter permease [unclassified Nonomuraea]
MIAIWLFGREFSDHTAKDLLALPTSRTAIVAAKFVVAAG